VAGYLIFNDFGTKILLLSLSIFLGSAASYAYNHITDMKEDMINNGRLNFFVEKTKIGMLLVVLLFISGFFIALNLSEQSKILYLILMILSVAYSGFRIKKTLLKNFYSGVTITITFLIGSLTSSHLTIEIIKHLPFVFVLASC